VHRIRRTPSQLHSLQQIPTQHDMLPQHLVYKNELNRECVVTLASNDETPWWWSEKIETCRSGFKCFKVYKWKLYRCICWLIVEVEFAYFNNHIRTLTNKVQTSQTESDLQSQRHSNAKLYNLQQTEDWIHTGRLREMKFKTFNNYSRQTGGKFRKNVVIVFLLNTTLLLQINLKLKAAPCFG